jgi:hypothetical protein
MEKEKIKQEIMAALSLEVDGWIEEQSEIKDGYRYEEALLKRALNMGRAVMEKSMGEVSGNRNKKNCIPVLVKLK